MIAILKKLFKRKCKYKWRVSSDVLYITKDYGFKQIEYCISKDGKIFAKNKIRWRKAPGSLRRI